MPYDISMPMHQGRELPHFTLRQIDLPEVISWEVNTQHYLILKVEVVAKRNRKDLDAPRIDKQKVEADFQVMSIKSLGKEPVDAESLERKDFERVVAQAKSGKI